MEERREGVRVALDVTVSEKLVAGTAKARAINLSSVGMRYTKPGSSPSHGAKEVFLEFTLPQASAPIRVMGWVVEEVATTNGLETAVTFMFLQEADENKINTYVKSQLSA